MPSITFHVSDHEYLTCKGLSETLLKKKNNPRRVIFTRGLRGFMEEEKMKGKGFKLELTVTDND